MARYKGKREAPRQELFTKPVSAVEEPAEQASMFEEDLFGGEVSTFGEVEDPFEEQAPKKKKGKGLIIAAAALLVVIVGAVAIWKSTVKPPDIPMNNAPDQTQNNTANNTVNNTGNNTQNDTPQEPVDQPPTDDELYPDDGFTGEVPAVSGSRKEGVYTFLLVGTDKDDGNTDTIMVVTYDTVNQDINIMSIPRDTMINESWDIKKINSVYSRTGNSINSLANRIQKLVGFKPDFYVKVELSMFVELVDLVGGVDFYVPQNMDYEDPWQDLYIHLKEGQQVLDGEKAMQLVRFRRYDEGDIKRVQVQQDFLKALIAECVSLKHWGKIKAYIDLALDNVQTDLEFSEVVWFASNVLGMNAAPMLTMDDVYTCTIPGNYYAYAYSRAVGGNQSYVTIYANQTVKLVNERFNPYTSNVTTGNLDIMSILDNGDIASSTGYVKDQEHNKLMAVQRGEAYYDADGNYVVGQPSAEVEVKSDEFGNYFIYDEDGNIIFTDENGVPLDPDEEPGEGTDSPDAPANVPDPGNTDQPTDQPSDQPADEPQLPEDSGTESGGGDEEMPDWLKPKDEENQDTTGSEDTSGATGDTTTGDTGTEGTGTEDTGSTGDEEKPGWL